MHVHPGVSRDGFVFTNLAVHLHPGGVILQAMAPSGWTKLEPLLCALMEGEFVAIADRAEEMVGWPK